MCDYTYNNDNKLLDFPPCLRDSIKELCLNRKITLTPLRLSDISIVNQLYLKNSLPNHHFILKLPYAGKKLTWEVIFNPEDLYFAPDFNFNDDNFLANQDIDIIIDNIPSLLNWNINDTKIVADVLKEFINLYRTFHIEKLLAASPHSPACDAYKSIKRNIKDIEVFVDCNSVHFLIPLKINFSELPLYVQTLTNGSDSCDLINPGDDYVNLLVVYSKPDGSQINTSIQFSPRLEQSLNTQRILRLPELDRDFSLSKHIMKVTKSLQNIVDDVVKQYNTRKKFVINFATICTSSLVEYDVDNFKAISFLYKVQDYECLVNIEIDDEFPIEPPEVTICSLYCKEDERKCNHTLTNLNYTRSYYDTEQIIFSILDALKEDMIKFKDHKH